MDDPHLAGMKAKLLELSDLDPIGFRKSAAWDALMAASELADVRKRLSADHISRLVNIIVSAADGAHHWRQPDGLIKWEHCGRCGIIKRRDGTNKPCRGIVGVTLRENPL